MSHRDYRPCPRCGIVREVHLERESSGLCRDCKTVEPEWPKIKRREAKCGTDSGYYSHVRYHRELACDDCLRAHRMVSLIASRRRGVKPPSIAQQERRQREAAERVA